MIVFSNTTPIIALSSIQCLDLLPNLFGEIHLVTEVIDECLVGGPISVPSLQQINWIKPVQSTPVQNSSVLLELDKGEKHTLDMACKYKADWVIIDEKIGRNISHASARYLLSKRIDKQTGSKSGRSMNYPSIRIEGIILSPDIIDSLHDDTIG